MTDSISRALADDRPLDDSVRFLRERDVHYDVCQVRLALARIHIKNGNYDKALEYMDRARGSFDEGNSSFARHREETVQMYNDLAMKLGDVGRKIVNIS